MTGSVATTGIVLAPVAFHRILFRRRRRAWLVEAAHKCARAGLILLAFTMSGVMFLVFDLVVGRVAAARGRPLRSGVLRRGVGGWRRWS